MRSMKALIIVLLLFSGMACATTAPAPATVTPQGRAAFYKDQTYKALGALRDTAVAASDAKPPLLDRNTMRKIVMWEDSAITTIHAAATVAAWKPVVLTGVDELMKSLTESEQNLIRPYVSLAKSVIQEIQ